MPRLAEKEPLVEPLKLDEAAVLEPTNSFFLIYTVIDVLEVAVVLVCLCVALYFFVEFTDQSLTDDQDQIPYPL